MMTRGDGGRHHFRARGHGPRCARAPGTPTVCAPTREGDGEMTQDPDALGPVGYLVVEFPGNKMTGNGLAALLELVDYGLIRVLDLAFVMVEADGSIHAIDISDIDGDGELD